MYVILVCCVIIKIKILVDTRFAVLKYLEKNEILRKRMGSVQ